jgi:adenine-specific DNA-methyltransferase
MLVDEIFGAENFVVNFVWNSSTGGGMRAKHVNISHQHILMYAKSIKALGMLYAPLSDEAISQYRNRDANGLYRDKDFAWKNSSNNPNQRYDIVAPDGEVIKPRKGYLLRFVRERFVQELSNGHVTFKRAKSGPFVKEDGSPANWNVYIKKYLGNSLGAPVSLLPRSLVGLNNEGTMEIQEIFGERIFEFPKSTKLLSYLLRMGCATEGIVLDFFSGSGTTADAVMQLNAEDGGTRRFIMVQLPEITSENSEAYNAHYGSISDIGKERLRRSGSRINSKNLRLRRLSDIGFRVFKLDTSNMIVWNDSPVCNDSDLYALEGRLRNRAAQIMEGRSDRDVVYEIMLKSGLDLTMSLVSIKLKSGRSVYGVGSDLKIIVCLASKVTEDDVREMVEYMRRGGTIRENGRVFFADFCFSDSVQKRNVQQFLRDNGVAITSL